MMKLKKIMQLLLVATMLVVIATGCSNTEAEGGDSKSNVTLTIMAPQDHIREVEQNVIAPMFEEETGIKIDFQITPSDQYDNLLATKLDTDAVTDLFSAQSGALTMEGRYNPAENCVDMSDMEWVKNYKDTTKAASSLDGKLYAFTLWNVEGGSHVVVYNKKVFADLGLEIPTTYGAWVEACETIAANTDMVPLYQSVVDSWHPTVSYIESFVQIEKDNPGTFDKLNKNEMKMVDVPGAVELTNQFKAMANNYSGDTYMSNEYVNAGYALASGEYAMTIDTAALVQSIAANYADEAYGNESDFGLFTVPYMDKQLYNVNPQGPSRWIYSGSEYVEEAKMYIEFLARPDIMAIMMEQEPAFWNLPFTSVEPKPTVAFEELMTQTPESATVMQAAVKYVDPQWMDVSKDIQSLYLGQMTAEELLENMDERRTMQAEQAGDEYWN